MNDFFEKGRSIGAVLLLLPMALVSFSASAQTACPQGVPPGDPRCGPSPSWHQGQAEPVTPAAPRVIVRERFQIWEDRWGALARDLDGPLGVSESQKSKEDAEKAAIGNCIERGGDPLRCSNIQYTYFNACVVFVWSEESAIATSGPDPEDNERRALAACQRDGGRACSVVYAGCSRSQDVGFCPKGVRPPHPSCGPPRQ